jgi:hypothetical protein
MLETSTRAKSDKAGPRCCIWSLGLLEAYHRKDQARISRDATYV